MTLGRLNRAVRGTGQTSHLIGWKFMLFKLPSLRCRRIRLVEVVSGQIESGEQGYALDQLNQLKGQGVQLVEGKIERQELFALGDCCRDLGQLVVPQAEVDHILKAKQR